MKTVDEVAKELGINENMLRNWEEKGFLGNVAEINGKKIYNEEQIERIKFIQQQVREQLNRSDNS
ncbi:MerR family transcriptional regulator [Oceanobacillus sp. CAU 1775]